MTQHDDQIWLTVMGEAWAIRKIERYGGCVYLHLWRGYEPDGIEYLDVALTDWDWPRYCDAARAVIDAQLRMLS